MSFLKLHINIKLRLVVQFISIVGSNMIFPFLAIYFSEKLGSAITGILIFFMVLMGVLGNFIGGYFADHWGRKKWMVFSEIFVTISFLLIALTNSVFELPSITFFLLLINTFFSGSFVPAVQSMIIDASTQENRKLVFTISYWTMNLGIAIGTLLGSFLFQKYEFELFVTLSIISLFSTLITQFFMLETKKDVDNSLGIKEPKTISKELKNLISNYSIVIKDRKFLIFFVSGILILSLENQITNYIGIRLTNEVSPKDINLFGSIFNLDGLKLTGLLQTENTIIVVFFMGFITFVFKKFSDRFVLYIGIFIYAIGYAILSLTTSPWVLFTSMAILTIGEIMYSPIRQTLLADLTPSNNRSSYMAVNQLTFQFAKMSGGLFIILGEFLSGGIIALTYVLMGIFSIYLINLIYPGVSQEKELNNSIDVK